MKERRLIVAMLAAAMVIVAADEATKGNEIKPQAFIAMGIAYMFDAAVFEVSPQLAQAIAALIFVAILYNRYGLFDRILKGGKR